MKAFALLLPLWFMPFVFETLDTPARFLGYSGEFVQREMATPKKLSRREAKRRRSW